LALWLGLFAGVFLRDTSEFRTMETVADQFSSRLDQDTRTGQLAYFFESVRPEELLLGKGSMATWNWGRTLNWGGGTDVGYLTLLLYGGVPLLLTYLATHIQPCFAVFARRLDNWQLTAAGVVLLWSIRMLSSSYIGVTLDYYPILFCVGACISREPVAYVQARAAASDLRRQATPRSPVYQNI